MLRDLGCAYAIVGHSERRRDHGETDDLIKAKAEAAIAAGLTAIVCIGETLVDRDAGRAAAVVDGQLRASLPDGAEEDNVVIAYEPVWAIGTGRTPTATDIADIHQQIRATLRQRLDGGRAGADPLRWFGQSGQCGRAPRGGRCRRRPGGRRESGCRRFLDDLPFMSLAFARRWH